jgi:hypothetical protein
MAGVTAIAALLFFMGLFREGDLRRWIPFTFVLAVFSALLTPIFYLPWAVLAIVIALAIYAASHIWGRWRRMWVGRAKALPTLGRITMILGAVIVAGAVLVTVDKPWLPAEVVDLRKPVFVNPQKHTQASRPVVFVISEQDGWVTMLVNYDRYLLRVPSTDVVRRRVCHLNWQLGNGRTLYQWLTEQPYHAAGLACWRLTDLRHQETAPDKRSTGPDS